MAVKVSTPVETKKEKSYPYIGISDSDTIVLFCAPQKGTVLNSTFFRVGHYSTNWAESNFKLFSGTVELSNE